MGEVIKLGFGPAADIPSEEKYLDDEYDSVTSVDDDEYEGLWSEGRARCLACGFKTVVVAPSTGQVFFPCPKCETNKLAYIHPMMCNVGDARYTCDSCEAEYFTFVVKVDHSVEIMCAHCGHKHAIDSVFGEPD